MIPSERNCIINPAHPKFAKIESGPAIAKPSPANSDSNRVTSLASIPRPICSKDLGFVNPLNFMPLFPFLNV